MNKDKRQHRRGGFYWNDGKPFVSVTTVLQVLDKPALRYWFGKQVYLAMVKDPTLNEKAALSAPYQVSDKAKSRGSTIHSIVEAYKAGAKVEDVPEEFRGYNQALHLWIGDNHVEILEHERTVKHEGHRYAGTLDLLVKLNGNDKPLIVDVKTGKDIYPEAFLQLSAYAAALYEEGVEADMAVLLLKEDGKYKFERGEPNMTAFLACKTLWEWLNLEDNKKLGYQASLFEGGI